MQRTKRFLPIALVLTFFLALSAPCRAIDVPFQQSPFTVLTWPIQVVWMVLMAPVELAQGFGKTVSTLFMPPDRQIPQVKPTPPKQKGPKGAPPSAKTNQKKK